MPQRGLLPPPVLDALRQVDLIIHLGDFTCDKVVEQLEKFAPLRAVHGNNDDLALRHRFPLVDRFEVSGHRVHLLHGHVGARTALEAARKVEDADVVLFGHSHLPHNAVENGRLLFNPGSPTDRRWGPHRAFGIIEIGDDVDARLQLLS